MIPSGTCSSDHSQIPDFQAEKWLKEFWSAMAVRYGQLWTGRWKDVRALGLGQATWQSELTRFTPDQIDRALRQFTGEYPPSLNALVSACRSHPMHQRYRALPVPKADPDKALKHLRDIRGALSSSRSGMK